MAVQRFLVELPYDRARMNALFDIAKELDLDKGGRYGSRQAAIQIWTHPWVPRVLARESTHMTTLFFHWGDPGYLYAIDVMEHFDSDAALSELARLETLALGQVMYGQTV